MAKQTKIVFIGAGSMSFGLSMFKDIFMCRELEGSTLSLVDIDPENLERMYNLALVLNQKTGMNLRIEKTTDRRDVLSGAGFIVNSLAIERCELWKKDFQIPKKYGIRHTLGENGGPGGLFFTMRTIPVIMDIARDIEALCPDAYFLNFSNPESRIILALGKYTPIKCVGLCHGIFMGANDVARIMGKPVAEIEVFGAGFNHFQWLLQIRGKAAGEDLYPRFKAAEASFDPGFEPFCRKLYHTFGYYPSCSDDHVGEYLPYGWEAGEEGYDFGQDESERVKMRENIRDWTNGTKPVEEALSWSGERAVQVITGILYNKNVKIESGIVYNNGAIHNLPADLAVEVPIAVDINGIHPVSVGDLPGSIQKLLMLQAGAQQWAVEAAVYGSREMAMQALLVDPVVNSMDAAEKILGELWEINKPYIRKCL